MTFSRPSTPSLIASAASICRKPGPKRLSDSCRGPAPPSEMYQITRLSNGLTVVTAEMPHMASVSLGLWVAVGGRYEPGELNGVSHFIEHLLFKGTKRRSAREISQAVEGIGGYLNAFTGEEMTCYHSKACHDRFGEL